CRFFFQAEDGIRDDLVTGVQTCALPISCYFQRRPSSTGACLSAIVSRIASGTRKTKSNNPNKRYSRACVAKKSTPASREVTERRSEERRVGKEGRARGRVEGENENGRDT